ncbi:MAG: 50S ribosomal protein L24 [Saprospiraceae bacterium]|nr:50S ribosomal protein L24 [Saprospiraceae bacterium]
MKSIQKRFQPKLKIRKDDIVKVIAGADKGKQGKVLSVIPEKNRAVVEGVNIVKKHQKPNANNPQGGILEQEAPIHISNLMVVDSEGNPTRVGRKVEDGKLVRFSKKSKDQKIIK